MARRIEVELIGTDKSLSRTLGKAQGTSGGLGRALKSLGKIAAVGVASGLLAVGIAAKIGFSEFQDNQKVLAQTEAVLKSTGNAARVTAKHVDTLAGSISDYSGQDDEAVQAGENLLLTFTQIQNRVGKTNDIFDQATKVTADLSQAMGMDMTRAALQVGKALNDPERGYARLQRIGVAFTKGQVASIKAMSKAGNVMGAQKVILAELNKEFGGSAKAFGQTLPGKLAILRESFRNTMGAIVAHSLPAMLKVAAALQGVVDFIRSSFTGNLKDGLAVAAEGFAQFARDARTALSHVVFDWDEIVPIKAGGKQIEGQGQAYATIFHAGLVSQIASLDWSMIGAKIGEGITISDAQLGKWASGLLTWVNAHAQQFAETGAVIAVRIVTTLTDPAFWAKHMDLLVALLLLRFGGSLVKGIAGIGARAGSRLVESLIGGMAGLVVRVARALEGVSPTVGKAFANAAIAAGRGIGAIVGILRDDLQKILGKVPGWIKAAFAISALITFYGAIQTAIQWVESLIGKVKEALRWIGLLESKDKPAGFKKNKNIGGGDFGGPKAMGGPVRSGMGYVVGERGPEWFQPRQDGTIIPNGGGDSFHFHSVVPYTAQQAAEVIRMATDGARQQAYRSRTRFALGI